jgi:TetR/AcrR family transcriptional regulator, cholesterol catabolism regulator
MSDTHSVTELYTKQPPREPAGSRADVSRQQILAVSARLLREHGYAETSLRDIAAAVGMKAGSLYYHFESKELLVSEILRIGVERVHMAVTRRLASLPPAASHRERICAATTAHLETLLAESDFSSAHTRCYPYAPSAVKESIRQARRDYEQVWSRLFEAAAQDGALSEGAEPRTARLAVLGALNSSLEWFDPARDEPHKIAEMLAVSFIRED